MWPEGTVSRGGSLAGVPIVTREASHAYRREEVCHGLGGVRETRKGMNADINHQLADAQFRQKLFRTNQELKRSGWPNQWLPHRNPEWWQEGGGGV